MRRRTVDIIRGIIALGFLVALLVAVPWALVTQVGWPLPAGMPSWDELSRSLTRGDLQDSTIIKGLAVLVWLAWAQLAASVVAEVAAVVQRRPSFRIPGSAPLRPIAANLVASVAVLLSTLVRPSITPDQTVLGLELAVATTTVGDAHVAGEPPPSGPPTDRQGFSGVERGRETVHGDAPRWTVQPRDSLWDIAERCLGDGLRWREIHRLNAGRIQPDGGALGDDGHIRPGWILVLPADASSRGVPPTAGPRIEAEADAGEEAIVVERGDTLWALSGQHLGDPTRWPELYEENRGDRQADGRQLTDPDLIHPGWVLERPDDEDRPDVEHGHSTVDERGASEDVAATAADANGGRSAPVAPDRRPTEQLSAGTGATSPSSDGLDEPLGDSSVAEDSEEDAVADRLVAVAGVALVAAGVVATLDRIRRSRRRRRRPGERIRLPDGEGAATELRIRGLADAADLDRIDRALRSMASARAGDGRAAPAIVLVSSSSRDLAVHLAKPHDQPPEGWRVEDGGLTWVLDAEALLESLDAEHHVGSPAPLLVSVGTTADGHRRVMLNLGHIGRLSLEAPLEVRRRVLLHMALELATTGRAHALDVVVHGFGGQLSSLERIRFCAERDDVVELVAKAAIGEADPTTGATVALVADRVDVPAHIVVEGGGVALVSADDGAADWTLREQGDALHLAPAGLDLEPLELTSSELEAVGELILQAKKGPTVPAVEDGPGSAGGVTEKEDPAATQQTGVQWDDKTAAKPIEVKILGPVEVAGAVDLNSAKAEELIVYLATHRKGATLDRLQEALWPDENPSPGRLHTTAWRARKSLSNGPDGEPLLPTVGKGRYVVSTEVGLDYDRFRAHVARARVTPAAAIEELRAALELVRGEPYAGTASEYTWASLDVHTIAQAVGDAAHWLAQLYLDAAQPVEARWAAEQGLRADPYLESLYRDLMEAAAAESNIAEVEVIMKRLRRLVADSADDNDAEDRLDPETVRCYEELASGRSLPR